MPRPPAGRQLGASGAEHACVARTPLGSTRSRVPQVSLVGASCADDWNFFAERANELLSYSCELDQHPFASFDEAGELFIRMEAKDSAFLEGLETYFGIRTHSYRMYDRFNACWEACIRDRYPDLPAYGYVRLRDHFTEERKNYRDEFLEARYEDLANRCNSILQDTDAVSAKDRRRLTCRNTP